MPSRCPNCEEQINHLAIHRSVDETGVCSLNGENINWENYENTGDSWTACPACGDDLGPEDVDDYEEEGPPPQPIRDPDPQGIRRTIIEGLPRTLREELLRPSTFTPTTQAQSPNELTDVDPNKQFEPGNRQVPFTREMPHNFGRLKRPCPQCKTIILTKEYESINPGANRHPFEDANITHITCPNPKCKAPLVFNKNDLNLTKLNRPRKHLINQLD